MRKYLSWIVVVVEFGLAIALASFAWNLPGGNEVNGAAEHATRAAAATTRQIQLLRKGVADLRRPELQNVIDQLEQHTATIAKMLNDQTIDLATLAVVRDALGDAANGLEGLAKTVDPGSVQTIANGLGETAAFLETKLAPGAEDAATKIEVATATLQKNAHALQELIAKTPLDMNAVRDIRDALIAVDELLQKVGEEFIPSLKLADVATSINGAANTVYEWAERLDRVSAGKKAHELSDRMGAAGKAVETFNKKVLPKVQDSLTRSRKVLDRTRKALDLALSQQDKIEPLLKDLPNQFARLADAMPQIGADLAGILRETGRIKSTAQALRKAEQHINTVVASWPKIQSSLGRGAVFLRASQQQLDRVIADRPKYDKAIRQTATLAKAFTEGLPVFRSQLARLDEEDQILGKIEIASDDTTKAIPPAQATAITILRVARWAFCLGAALPFCYGLQHVFNLLARQPLGNNIEPKVQLS